LTNIDEYKKNTWKNYNNFNKFTACIFYDPSVENITYNFDEIVKSRYSRENGNPENSNPLKALDSCFRRND